MFKSDFKYYKSKRPPPDLSNVLDFNTLSDTLNDKVTSRPVVDTQDDVCKRQAVFGLKPTKEWKIYELVDAPGLIFILNPFTARGQRYWVCKCLRDFTLKPQRLNIDKHEYLDDGANWWELSSGSKPLLTKLRWATLGYHHNWDTKVYSENDRSLFPTDLDNLSQFIAATAGFSNFKAEAAIINFYHMGSTLSGHTDYSEVNQEAPLISVSFGQSAIFLIGGLTRDEKPTALYIHSGDIVIMSGESRLHYHGVPKILRAPSSPWDMMSDVESDGSCINLHNPNSDESEVPTKKLKTSVETDSKDLSLGCDQVLLQSCGENQFWEPYEHYIKMSRINMNVRQVLLPGQEKLEMQGDE